MLSGAGRRFCEPVGRGNREDQSTLDQACHATVTVLNLPLNTTWPGQGSAAVNVITEYIGLMLLA